LRLARTRSREVFVPLAHPPDHAQVDFGECIGVIGGVRMKLHVFCFDLPHSDACFVKAYPAETTEVFLDGHVSAFAFFGGVPISILYDNLKIAVVRTLGDGKRLRTRARLAGREQFGTSIPVLGFRPIRSDLERNPVNLFPSCGIELITPRPRKEHGRCYGIAGLWPLGPARGVKGEPRGIDRYN
jgi:hypothetical protein